MPFPAGGGFRREQAAVVGWQADGWIALVDDFEKIDKAVIVVGGHGRVGVAVRHSAGNVVPHALAQAVVVVTPVVDRQQVPVLGIEHEEQSIEEDQGGLANPGQGFACGIRQSLHEFGEDALEDDARQILGDLSLIASPLRQSVFQERGGCALSEREGIAAKQQVEETKTIFLARLEHLRQVCFKVAAGARPCAVVIKAPNLAVRQYSPSDATVRLDFGRREVSEDLTVGCAGRRRAVLIAGIQSEAEPLALFHRQSVPVAIPGHLLCSSPPRRLGILEQEMVGDVLVTRGALLGQRVDPSQEFQNGTDQLLLGHRFVRVLEPTHGLVAEAEIVFELGEGLGLGEGSIPLDCGLYPVGEEILGE